MINKYLEKIAKLASIDSRVSKALFHNAQNMLGKIESRNTLMSSFGAKRKAKELANDKTVALAQSRSSRIEGIASKAKNSK